MNKREEIKKAAELLLCNGLMIAGNTFEGVGFFDLNTGDGVADFIAEYDRDAAEYTAKHPGAAG